jgi:hypothetical protein
MRLRSLEGNDQAFDLGGQVVGIVGNAVQNGDQLTIDSDIPDDNASGHQGAQF